MSLSGTELSLYQRNRRPRARSWTRARPGRHLRIMMSVTSYAGLGERLRDLREQRGLTQMGLAAKSGVALMTAGMAERHDLASEQTLARLALALGVSAESLTGTKRARRSERTALRPRS